MGKSVGFMQYKRETPAKRPIRERIGDWQLLQLPMAENDQMHGLWLAILP